jgi:hypothetical protein
VISVMGNRFVLVRIDSEDDANREEFGLQSIDNLGSEAVMHQELAAAVAGVLAGATKPAPLTRAQKLVLVRAANLATKPAPPSRSTTGVTSKTRTHPRRRSGSLSSSPRLSGARWRWRSTRYRRCN